jgi:hypothetical protein
VASASHLLDISRNASTSIPVWVPITISKNSRIDSFAAAREDGLEWLSVLQLRLRVHQITDMVEAKNDLRVHWVLDPERAVLVEFGDTLPRCTNPCSTNRW